MDMGQVSSMAERMRRDILDISHTCNKSVHLGGGLSIVDITATLYGAVMNYDPKNPAWEERDRFILSKGHGVLGFYSGLLEAGIISREVFSTFMNDESDLIAHPVMNLKLGIESSNGSLGHGLSMGIGLAIAAKKKRKSYKTYVLLGNGECNEGSVWEAAMCASHFKLDNLVAIVDNNRYQSDGQSEEVMCCNNQGARWQSFGWDVHTVDGHDIQKLYDAFQSQAAGAPKVIIANTVKGKGVPFMENNNEWHHNRLTKTHYDNALQELKGI